MAVTYSSKSTLGMSFKQAHKEIDKEIEYFKSLRSKEFHRKRKARIERGLKSIVFKEAMNTVEVYVYQAWPDPGTRTYNLLRSIKVNVGNGKDNSEAYIEIFSDPRIAPSAIEGLEDFSYAAYFIDPERFNTFLQPRGMSHPNTHRPFFGAWEKFMKRYMPERIKEKTEETMLSMLPASLRS